MCLADASKSGVAREAMHNIKRGIRGLTEPEARQILGVTEKSSWDEVLKVCFSLGFIAFLLFIIQVKKKPFLLLSNIICIFCYRDTTSCSNVMQKAEAFISNQRFIELKNA